MSKATRLPTPLSRRKADTHKGDYGHVLVVAGSLRCSGAALLCSQSCLRSGAGLVTLAVPPEIIPSVLRNKIKEVMVIPLRETAKDLRRYDALAVGPGLGTRPATQQLVLRLLKDCACPMVIDADGLNCLAGRLQALKTRGVKGLKTVLTPHAGEMARLLGSPVEVVEKDRKKVAKTFARHYNSVIVLKGHRTIVADPVQTYINHTGNPGMATAGSGDVLTGMIAAFLGQGLDCFSAARAAVYLHGVAGDIAADEKTQIGMIASDIIAALPQAFKRCQ